MTENTCPAAGRRLRRFKQQLSQEDCAAVLARGTSGVLALCGEDAWPYALPLSYVYHNGQVFFHTAPSGYKLDLLARNERASFCVIDEDRIVPEAYTAYFRSAIAFGRLRVLDDPAEKRAALEALAAKYSPELPEGRQKEVEQTLPRVVMLAMTVDYLSGKEAIEFVREKQQKTEN